MATSPRGPPRKSPPYGHGVAIAASMTKPGTSHRRQKRMGPAPFASFEDLSDELDSPEDKNATNVVRLPGIREDATPCSPAAKGGEIRAEFIYTGISLIGAPSTPTVSGHTPTIPSVPAIGEKKSSSLTPRIDISRASSSSHHDSKESTPDDDAEKDAAGGGKLAFEEGAAELRSSTEDIDASKKIVRVPQPPPSTSVAPPVPRVHSPHDQQLHDDSYHSHNRKDSQSSEIGLLCISGRTSRLSSIGSQGSAQSRISNASHLSVVSGASRSPSPHKMLLETSFCGTKPKRGDLSIDLFEGKEGEDEGTKELEKVLLQRQHDPTKALIAEGVDLTPQSPRSPIVHEPEVIVRSPVQQPVVDTPKALKKPLEKVTIKIDKPPSVIEPSDDVQRPKLPKHIISDSGTEFIYIPLKGPLPEDPPGFASTISKTTNGVQGKTKVRETKSASGTTSTDTKDREKRKSKSASPSPAMSRHYQTSSTGSSLTHQHGENPKYIRIRLKPEHLYDDYDPNAPKTETQTEVVQKPETLNLQSKFDEITISPSHYQVQTPKSRHLTKESPRHHKSPSPSLSRKSSFASLFKSRETISPESPTLPGRSKRTKDTHRRSRSKSRERGYPSSTESIDSKGKSMFSLFSRPRKTSSRQSLDRSPGPDLPNLENLAQNIQNTSKSKRSNHYETPLQGESVRIPLHSPTYYESKCFLESFKTSSQDSQETVIEVKTSTKQTEADKSKETEEGISGSATSAAMRQSSTSSENIVFSTKLGSSNEIFTTKLPKHQEIIETTTAIVEYVKERVTSEDEAFLHRSTSRSGSIAEIATKKVEHEEPEVVVKEEPTRRLSTSTSNESRKFKLEKSKRADSSEQLTINLTQSTMSTCYIPSEDPVVLPSPVRMPKQDSEDIPIIAKEKEKFKLAELKKPDDHYSSESERESDFDRREKPQVDEVMQEMEPERKGLVLQQDSFDDDLPYIPTTLPQERSMAVPIIPVKQRANMEVKTCTIERPRSTTPIKPTLEVYREPDKQTKITKADKLKISLPKQDEQQPKVKSPRRRISGDEAFSAPVSETADWFDFTKARTSLSYKDEETPPPLPPKGIQKEWINFEEIPEKRKPPKRIQTIPSRGNIEVPETLVQSHDNVIYTYVNPEECKCECHERPGLRQPPPPPAPPPKYQQTRDQRSDLAHCHPGQDDPEEDLREDEMPLLDDDDDERVVERDRGRDTLKPDRRSVISDSSVDLSTASQSHQPSHGHAPEETANGTSRTGTCSGMLQTPFTSDLGVSGGSNRSSIISQDEQISRSPD